MKKSSSFYIKDFGWKILSVLLAILTWIVSMGIQDPIMTENFTVKLSFENEEYIRKNGLYLLNEDELRNTTVDVKMKATRNNLIEYNKGNAGQIRAYVDFKPANVTNIDNVMSPTNVSIHVDPPNSNFEILDYKPRTTDLLLDEYVDANYKVTVNKTGIPSANYDSIREPIVTPDIVVISGAQTYIDSITEVSVSVDIEDADKDIVTTGNVHVYNNLDEDITELFDISHEIVDVYVPIDKYKKIPIDAPIWTGDAQDGYDVNNVTWSPEYVELIGSDEDLDKIQSIVLDPVNITGAKSDVVVTQNVNDLLNNNQISVRKDTPEEITITFGIHETLTTTIDVPSSQIEYEKLPNTAEIQMPSYFQIAVSGSKESIDSLVVTEILASADFSELSIGINQVPVNVTLPVGLNLVNDPTIEVMYYDNN